MTATRLQLLFARRVRILRVEGGHTQEGFAHAAGLDRACYGKLERGRSNCTLRTVAAIATALGVEVAELFRFGARGNGR